MIENGTTLPPKGLGSIRWHDLLKSLYYACGTQVIALIAFLFTGLLQEHPHFPTWAEWLPYVKATLYGIGGYITAKLGVNNVGQIFTKDKPVVHVDAEELAALREQANEATDKKN